MKKILLISCLIVYNFFCATTLSVTQFGANGKDEKDDTIAFQKCADQLASLGGGTMDIPLGTYYISHVKFLGKKYSNITFKGNGSTIKQVFLGKRVLIERWNSYSRINAADGCFLFDAQVSKQFDDRNSIKNIVIDNLHFLSDVVKLGFDELSHQVSAHGVSGFTVKNSSFTGFLGDGLSINAGVDFLKNYGAYNKDVTIVNCIFDGINNENRQGISFYYCDGFLVENCTFKNITRDGMPAAIDVEPMDNWQVSRNGIIRNCDFTNIGGVGAIVIFLMDKSKQNPVKSSYGFIIENCNFNNVRTPLTVIGNDSYRNYNDGEYKVIFRNSTTDGFKTLLDFRKAYGVLYENLTFKNNDKLYLYKQQNEFYNFTIKSSLFDNTDIQNNFEINKNSVKDLKFLNNRILKNGKASQFFF